MIEYQTILNIDSSVFVTKEKEKENKRRRKIRKKTKFGEGPKPKNLQIRTTTKTQTTETNDSLPSIADRPTDRPTVYFYLNLFSNPSDLSRLLGELYLTIGTNVNPLLLFFR